jgi:undecaprenyl-diphosphatase
MNLVAGALDALDAQVAAAVQRLATPTLTEFMSAVSAVAAPRAITAVTLAAAALLVLARERGSALWLAGVVFGGASLNHLLKHTIRRPRPGMEAIAQAATDYSFPSGHVANTTLLCGAVAALVFRHAASLPVRAVAAGTAAVLVLLVGASRLVLNAHRFSDVVAGAVLGLLWLLAVLLLRRAVQRRWPLSPGA